MNVVNHWREAAIAGRTRVSIDFPSSPSSRRRAGVGDRVCNSKYHSTNFSSRKDLESTKESRRESSNVSQPLAIKQPAALWHCSWLSVSLGSDASVIRSSRERPFRAPEIDSEDCHSVSSNISTMPFLESFLLPSS